MVPGLNTQFIGILEAQGVWAEKCAACGQCRLGEFVGVCPITRCATWRGPRRTGWSTLTPSRPPPARQCTAPQRTIWNFSKSIWASVPVLSMRSKARWDRA
ncbi:MAG: hypothetical protein GY873_16475 [Bosea sp.]|nr:hypothetical protein [Bosea sp. (in: a-proteobacteria)]